MFRPSSGHLQGVHIGLCIVLFLRHEHVSSYTVIKATFYEALYQIYVSATAFEPSNNINT
jgi:hypothetical protein